MTQAPAPHSAAQGSARTATLSVPVRTTEAEIVVVANRLPVQAPAGGRGAWTRSPGGLAAALDPMLAQRGGRWVGWPGGRPPAALPDDLGYAVTAVDLEPDSINGYYDGMSNGTLWPLYHDLVRPPVYRRDWWAAYEAANTVFADAIARTAAPGAAVWVHDYHLQLVPALLRQRRPDVRIGFFLHIPFPGPDLFARLPWRREILEGIAAADVIGFQTQRDVDNFVGAARRVTATTPRHRSPLGSQEIAAFPISVDFVAWDERARRSDVAMRAIELREQLGNPEGLLLGIDRLDYTKGIENRLNAFRELLADGTLSAPNVVAVQVASPSRDRTAAYRNERARIERLVGEINGTYGLVGRPALHYIQRPLDPLEVAALYRAADVMLVTPIHDGMNLVAKEFVASRIANRGVLVLSEFAGAAFDLDGALLVNPHDVDGLKQCITMALALPSGEVTDRMTRMRAAVESHDVHDWADSFLDRLLHVGPT